MATADAERTVVLGFDALDFRYLDEFSQFLPELSALRSEGVEAPLDSTLPPWTGSAWPSMYTGTDPSHHGVFSFFDYDASSPETAELVTRGDVKQPAIWDYLTAEDVPAIVLNVPVTHPAEPIEGVLIPGYLAPEDADGYPPAIRDELDEALDEPYRIYSRAESSDDKEEKLAGYLDLIKMRGEAATYLLAEYDWEVAIIQVQKTDAVFHNFEDRDAFRRVYQQADELVGEIRDAVDDANFLVCSDHGMGPTDGYAVYVNDILERHGIVESIDNSTHPSLATRKSTLTESTDNGTSGETPEWLVSGMATTIAKLPVSPGTVYTAAERLSLGSLLRSLVPSEVLSSLKRGVDWQTSKAYCRLGSELGVRINLEGRDPHGVVPEEEYEPLRDRLIEILSDLETPDGDPVFEFVERREERYSGPYTEDACDVVFMPADMNHIIGTRIIDTPFVSYDAFDHKRTGVFIGAGPAFESEGCVGRLQLPDVAPTVLSLAGLAIPERMTGTVPADALNVPVESDSYGDLSYGDVEAYENDDSVTEHLQNLGYLS